MKLTDKQNEAIDQFGINAWYVRELIESGVVSSVDLAESWGNALNQAGISDELKIQNAILSDAPKPLSEPILASDDELMPIQGGVLKIVENMQVSLSVPVATSLRSIPVKLLEENRKRINQYLKKNTIKVSYTHIIAWAIVKAVLKHPAMNRAYTVIHQQPHIIKHAHVNIGIAVDIERKDGSRSLIVPNIKNTDTLNFRQFVNAYIGIIGKTRSGKIDRPILWVQRFP
jgi:multifunctional 2-oxoglutarate metabolism enzyme